MAKTFELFFSIGGKLAGSLKTALTGATGMLDALGKKSREIQNAQRDAEKLSVAGQQWRQSAQAYAEIQAKVRAMAQAMRDAGGATKKTKSEFDASVATARRLKEQVERQRGEYTRLASAVRAAGGSVRNLASHQAALAKQGDVARRSQERLQAVMAKIQANQAKREKMGGAMMSGMGGAVFGGIAAGFATDKMMSPGIDLQHAMALGGNIANMSRSEIAATTDAVRQAARQTNQEVMEMAGAWSNLLAKGLDNDQAVATLQTLGKVATGEGAVMEDLSNTAFSLMDNLKIKAEELPKVMDILAQAGKAGSFELRDMAKFFPQLTAGFRAFGIEGPEAAASLGAALQIAMKGAANPDEAANNMKNFLAKMSAPETIKHFKEEYGINLEKALKGAMKRGENPVEFMLKMVQRVTKGDQFRISELFGDMQVMNFLKPMMQNMEEFKKIRAEALGASGVVDTDFARMMETSKEQLKGLETSAKDLAITLGGTLSGTLGQVVGAARPILDWVNSMAQKFPTLTGFVVSSAGGFGALGLASAALGYVFTFMAGGWLNLLKLFQMGGAAISLLRTSTIGLTAVQIASAAGARIWAAAQMLLNTAFWANPITWVVAGAVALGAAAWWVVNNWETVKAFFSGLWTYISTAIAPIADGMKNAFNTVVEWVSSLNLFEAGSAFLSTFVDGVTSKAAEGWEAIKGVFAKIGNLIPHSDAPEGPFSTLTAGGAAIIQTMAQGLASVGGGPLVSAMTAAFGAARAAAVAPDLGMEFSAGAGGPGLGMGMGMGFSFGSGGVGAGAAPASGMAGVTINFSPVINVQGEASPGALEAPLRESESRLRAMIEQILAGDRRISYA